MEKKKIRVLCTPSDKTGVSKFRSTTPHIKLEELYPDEFHVDIDYEPQLDNDEWLKQYDIIHYHRALGPYEQMAETIQRLDRLGIVSIMDLDDYWSPGPHHPAYLLIKNTGLDKMILNNIKLAKNVTTTTPIFADEIAKFNKNVYVLPNAIDIKEKQYISNPEPSDRIRIAWLGGSCMTPDTEILTNEGWKRFDKLNQNEEVVTLNPETNEIEYHKPTGYICEPFEGELNCGKNNFVEYEVTPNHNMYASEAINLMHNDVDLKLIQSEKIHGKNFHIKRDCIKDNGYDDSLILVKSSEQYNRYYKGNVYCVEVENHIIYVRRNGKAMWIGNSHLKDLEILEGVVGRIAGEKLLDKVQFVLCGFDLRGTMTIIDEKTNQQTQRAILPHESVWYLYEKIFTDNYKTVSPEYKDFLLKFKNEDYSNVANEPYRRVWTKPISTYALNYNLFDIALAPIEDNIFNFVKSQLKVVESGFHKKALIAQDFGPYQIDIKNAYQFGGGWDHSGNGILIDPKKNHKDWSKFLIKLINNPELIKELGDNLHNTVKDTYSMNKVTEDRRNLYHKLLSNK